jgi:hypothetical protein
MSKIPFSHVSSLVDRHRDPSRSINDVHGRGLESQTRPPGVGMSRIGDAKEPQQLIPRLPSVMTDIRERRTYHSPVPLLPY